MNNILSIIGIIACVIFIIYNIVEIVLAHMFYKRMEQEHKALMDKLISKCVDSLENK